MGSDQNTDMFCPACTGFIKIGTCEQYLKTERLKLSNFVDSFENFIALAAVRHGFAMAAPLWWGRTAASSIRVGALQLPSIDQWRDVCARVHVCVRARVCMWLGEWKGRKR